MPGWSAPPMDDATALVAEKPKPRWNVRRASRTLAPKHAKQRAHTVPDTYAIDICHANIQ